LNEIIAELTIKWGLGLGIGDWAQSPIHNPQSPIPKNILILILISYDVNI